MVNEDPVTHPLHLCENPYMQSHVSFNLPKSTQNAYYNNPVRPALRSMTRLKVLRGFVLLGLKNIICSVCFLETKCRQA